MNSEDADELDEMRDELVKVHGQLVALSERAYPDAGDVAALAAQLATIMQALIDRLAYDARERETEPGDR